MSTKRVHVKFITVHRIFFFHPSTANKHSETKRDTHIPTSVHKINCLNRNCRLWDACWSLYRSILLMTYVCRVPSLHLVSRVKVLNLFYFAHVSLAVKEVVGVPILQVFSIGHHGGGFVGWTVHQRLVGGCGRQPLALDVGLYPEVGEEEEEEDTVHPNEVDPKGNLVVTLLHEVVLADVDGDQDKLRL